MAKKKSKKKKKSKSSSKKVKKTKIKVIGIGGGGSSIVSEIAPNIRKATFLAANTDKQALDNVPKGVKSFSFGDKFTKGLGAGMNPDLARKAADENKERIKKELQGQDLCVVVACLGGGTGSGAVPVFTRISEELGNLTYGIFTLPFEFEGAKKMQIARNSLESTKPHLNALSVIPNERIFKIIDKTTPLKEAFSMINDNLSNSLEGLIEMIYKTGLINIDFADLKKVLEARGNYSYLNSVEIKKDEKSTETLISEAINNPLYPYGIKKAKGILINIVGGMGLALSEVNHISQSFSDLVNDEAKIIFGFWPKRRYKGKIKVSLLATGTTAKLFSGEKTTSKRKKSKTKKKKTKKKKKKKKTKKTKKSKKVKSKSKKKKEKEKKKSSDSKSQKNKEKNKDKNKEKPKENSSVKKNKKDNSEKKDQSAKQDLSTRSDNENNKEKKRVKKNALEVKKEKEEAENRILEEEKQWEVPAFLRKNEN